MRAQVQGFMRRLWKTIGARHLPEKNKKPTLFLRECLRIEIHQLLFLNTDLNTLECVEDKMHRDTQTYAHVC